MEAGTIASSVSDKESCGDWVLVHDNCFLRFEGENGGEGGRRGSLANGRKIWFSD